MEQFQTWYFEGDFDQQREKEKPVAEFMEGQGYTVAYRHVRMEGVFVVFFREKK